MLRYLKAIIYINIFFMLFQSPAYGNLAEELLFPDNDNSSEPNTNGDNFEVSSLNEIRISGISAINIDQDSNSNKTQIEIIGDAKDSSAINLQESKKENGVVLIKGLGATFAETLPSEMPLIKIHLPQSQTKLKLVTVQEKKLDTKIYINHITIDNFNYIDKGSSSLSISHFDVKNGYFSNENPKNASHKKSSSDFEIRKIKSNQLTFNIEGSANVELDGKANSISLNTKSLSTKKIKLSNSVDFAAENLTVENCMVDIYDLTSVKMNITEKLTGQMFNNSTLLYTGDPTVTVKTNQKATLKKIEF